MYNPAVNQPGYNALTTPYLNNSYFAGPNPNPNAPITFGQLSRVAGFRMPNFYNEDVHIAKRFNFTEMVYFEIRADAFNIDNRHILAQPNNLNPAPNNVSSNFGFVTGTVDAPVGFRCKPQFVSSEI